MISDWKRASQSFISAVPDRRVGGRSSWPVTVEDVDCFGLNSTAPASRCIPTAPRPNENGAQGIDKSRGAWNTKIRMVAASDRMAMIVRLSGGHARDAPVCHPLGMFRQCRVDHRSHPVEKFRRHCACGSSCRTAMRRKWPKSGSVHSTSVRVPCLSVDGCEVHPILGVKQL